MDAVKLVQHLIEADDALDNPEAFLRDYKKPVAVRCVICCVNAGGEADFVPVVIEMTEDDYDLGGHYDVAKAYAEEEGYGQPYMVADEKEPLFKPFDKSVNWRQAKRLTGYRSGEQFPTE